AKKLSETKGTVLTSSLTITEVITGNPNITKEHMRNNADVRELLSKRGIKPEELPAEEDIQKLQILYNEARKEKCLDLLLM
ncbi:MAG: hypothetical protein RLZZ69_2937, partial [Cyanobacteriota bacterium]